MKAFKQINFGFEYKAVFSYAAILCLMCSFIMLNPLFGQEQDEQNSNKPEVRIDIQKEYDENGNIIGYDSTYKWFWSGKEITTMNFDSIFEKFHNDFDHWNGNSERNHFGPFGNFHYPGGQWNDIDSSLYADLDHLFDEGFMDRFNFNYDHFPFNDSTITSHFDFDPNGTPLEEFDQKFNMDDFLGNQELFEQLNRNQEAYMERFKEYQKEHQLLIEKYFGDPADKNDSDVKMDQNKYAPGNKKNESDKTGRI